MPITDPALWTIIRDWPLPFKDERDSMFNPPRICVSFEHNLRKDGDWTDESARRITMIYRQFLYLKALSGETLTPSEAMDRAWHLHLSFPENYAALCAAVGRDIPHRTDLTRKECRAAYERGRAEFQREFGLPDRDLWPSLTDAAAWRKALFVLAFFGVFGIGMGICFLLFSSVSAWVAVPIYLVWMLVCVLVGQAEEERRRTRPETLSSCG